MVWILEVENFFFVFFFFFVFDLNDDSQSRGKEWQPDEAVSKCNKCQEEFWLFVKKVLFFSFLFFFFSISLCFFEN